MSNQHLMDRITQAFNEDLRGADEGFDREPNAGIYNAYKQYVEAGNYPYVQATADYLMTTYNVDEDLAKAMYHEVYLCNQQARKDKTLARAKDMQDKGYFKATRESLEKGKTYMLSRYTDGMFNTGLHDDEKVRCTIDADNHVFLMPMRNTRRGYMLDYEAEYWVKEV